MRKNNSNAILLLSGGIDSNTLLWELTKAEYKLDCLIFDYGQSLHKEIKIAERNAILNHQNPIILKTPLDFLESECTLLTHKNIEIARDQGEIYSKTPSSYVPFRNGIFLAYAVAYAESKGISLIFAGANGLNSGLYWDDTTRFADSFTIAANTGTSPDFQVSIQFPYAELKKYQIVLKGHALGIDYKNLTWSCYKDQEKPCGKCDSCFQRKLAFKEAIYENVQNQ